MISKDALNVWIGAVVIVCSAGLGQAAPPRERPPIRDRMQDRAQDEATAPGARAERLKMMLEQRLERLHEQEAALQEALDRLGQGQRPDIEPWMLAPDAGRRTDRREPGQARPGDPGLGGPRVDAPGGGADRGPGAQEGPPIDRERLMAFLQENNPRLHRRLERLRQHDPEAFDRAINERTGRFRELIQQRAQDPEAFARRRQAFAAREAVHAAARNLMMNPDDEQAMAKVREAVANAYDLQLELHESNLARMSEELEKARGKLDEQRANRDALIDERVGEVIESAVGASLDEAAP